MTDIKQALDAAIKQLAGLETARIDAEVLLATTLNKNRTFLYAHPEFTLDDKQWRHYQQLLQKRQEGRPIAYLTGKREFWSMHLSVSPATLIPRPETELLIEIALELTGTLQTAKVVDLGTGSGAIALALASERPKWQITALDYSAQALEIAQKNAAELGLSHVAFMQSNWFAALKPQQDFDLIVANPPYIADNDPHLQQGDVRFEPLQALVSGNNGLNDLKKIISQAILYLKPGGLLLVEHGYDQKSAVGSMLNDYGYDHVQCWQDWQGNDRVSGGKQKSY